MSSKLRKRIAVFLLAVVLAGCKQEPGGQAQNVQKEEQSAHVSTDQEKDQPEKDTKSNTSPEYIWKEYPINVEEHIENLENIVVCELSGQGEQIFALIENQHWEEAEDYNQKPKCTSQYYLFSCMADGSEQKLSRELLSEKEGEYVFDRCVSENGTVACLVCSEDNGSVQLVYRDVFRDIAWEMQIEEPGSLFIMSERIMNLVGTGEDYRIDCYDASGRLNERISLEGDFLKNIRGEILNDNENIFVLAADADGKPYVAGYNLETQEKTKWSLPIDLGWSQLLGVSTSGLWLANERAIFWIDTAKNSWKELFCYVDDGQNICGGGFRALYFMTEYCFAGAYFDGSSTKLSVYRKEEVPESAPKKTLILGAFQELDSQLKEQISDFNRTNSEYRLKTKMYLEYPGGPDPILSLNQDILLGKMPDILMVNSSLPLWSYRKKGLLADVGKLIEKDSEMTEDQFLPNVLNAFRVNGVLDQVVTSFHIDTMAGKQSKVGAENGWDYEAFMRAVTDSSGKTEILSEQSRYDFLETYLRVCGRELVDLDRGTCNFQTKTFASLLEFAATLPETVVYKYHEDSFFDSSYIEDKVLLLPLSFRYFLQMGELTYGCFGEEISFVGYPSKEKNGACICVDGPSFVLSKNSENLDGAWAFVRRFLTYEYQFNLGSVYPRVLPVRNDNLAYSAKVASERDGYCWVNYEFFSFPPMTQEEIERAMDFIKGVQYVEFRDDVILRIVREEAEGFFCGKQTVKDAIDLIQNRVQLYLDEKD
ncbi:MAG: hypothetical protein ACI4FY_11650 [Acetatifactor sp.]